MVKRVAQQDLPKGFEKFGRGKPHLNFCKNLSPGFLSVLVGSDQFAY